MGDEMLSELVPDDTPDYMVPAWIDCMLWASGEPEIVARFRADTGVNWTPGQSGIERLIDKATGAEESAIKAFVQWFNVNVWGPVEDADALSLD
jgi:hypothetical protein